METTLLSFVIPCYRSELTIESVTEEIIETVSQMDGYDYEIICVNDCSPDRVYSVLERLAAADHKIKVINFAKNMGKHAAVLAGYRFVAGEYVVTLDDDMQCPVYDLPRLLEPVEQDQCDASCARYEKKHQAWWKNLGSAINNKMSEVLLQKPKGMNFGNFSVYKRFVADAMAEYPNPYPYLEGLLLRTTGRIMMVDMQERERGDGLQTGYTLKKSAKLLVNGLTAFSVLPLRISAMIGVIAALLGFVLGLVMIVQKILNPSVPLGYTSTVVLQLFMSGLILMSLGMLGEYVGRIYISINKSPQYVIHNTINIDSEHASHLL